MFVHGVMVKKSLKIMVSCKGEYSTLFPTIYIIIISYWSMIFFCQITVTLLALAGGADFALTKKQNV